ncbi:hypothetical protein GCM10028803_12900 [Larkinella knui]|uniref:Uncharacterized protein n=1 Tax=Larkinella knui TaxID=2025310 RepID=A0A3P1CBP8_9BACT|nr:hypothetical protein [Larkinella knui]RRB10753.1 hypothetical protein EHT87_26755 [Larkinella knui]
MSQHPIDDLFANQLRDHGVKPQRASWDELQRRMNEKEERKSPFIWWYASAASVAVILLASWWLWSGNETGKTGFSTNPIAQRSHKKSVPSQTHTPAAERKTEEVQHAEEPVVAYEKPIDSRQNAQTVAHRQPAKTVQPAREEPSVIEPVATPGLLEEARKPETVVAEVKPKQTERTLVVQIAAPELAATSLAASAESETSGFAESNDDQPKKKRFRLGRVLRQFNKLKAGESVEWEEVGVQPGALLARASERVQEGKEKISNSYENLRYNAFKKNSNNK